MLCADRSKKIDKLTHQDLGTDADVCQLYYDRCQKLPDENPTIGILLCKKKNDAVVQMTLPENNNIFCIRVQPVSAGQEDAAKRSCKSGSMRKPEVKMIEAAIQTSKISGGCGQKAVVDVFAGQPYLTPTLQMDRGAMVSRRSQ